MRASAAIALALTLTAAPLPAAAAQQAPAEPSLCAGEPCPVAASFDHWPAARRLRYGYGMTADDVQAAEWYRRAAEQGDPRAMHNLGIMLLRGEGMAADADVGRQWLHRAMARGATESAFALGLDALDDGRAERARALLLFAAERNHARAMHALGNMHAAGLGGPTRLAEAYFWYRLAAQRRRDTSATARDAARASLPEALRREADARADRWRPLRD